MNPILIQIGITVTFGLAVARNVVSIHSHRLGWRGSMFWVLLWSGGVLVVWFPILTTRAAHLVGIGRGVDVVLYFSVALFSYLIFRLYVAMERQEAVITRLVTELALNDLQPHAEGGQELMTAARSGHLVSPESHV